MGDGHQAKLPVRCAHRREHPELTQPTLGDDHEAGSRDERHEQQGDRVQRQRGDDRRSAVRRATTLREAGDADRGGELPDRVGPAVALVGMVAGQEVDGLRGARIDRQREDELVVELGGVLDDPHDGPRVGANPQLIPDTDSERCRDPVGDGHLAGLRRVQAVQQCEQRAAVQTVWILGAKVDVLHGTGNRKLRVPDLFDRCVLVRKLGDLRPQRLGIGAGQREPAVGVAELR